MSKIFKSFVVFLLKLVNYCIKVEPNSIYFIPHPNCRKDLYDILNYSSDNVLSFFHYCLISNKLKGKIVYLQIYDISQIDNYYSYIKKLDPNLNIKFILSDYFIFEEYNSIKALKFWFIHFQSFCKSSYVFTAAYWYNLGYKLKSQKVICLNYFVPFKFDPFLKSFNSSFDYCLTTSPLFAAIDSLASGIDYHKYVSLGFPRNDNLVNSGITINSINDLLKDVPYKVEKVLIYTPTYRDYDYNNTQKRNLFGYSNSDSQLSKLLERNGAVLFVKLHPLQRLDVFHSIKSSSIILLTPSINYSLYDLLSISSLLITDYTSTYFDYLLLKRPVIFNFYDVVQYKSMRGFSFDPIESVCIGEIVYSYEELIKVISDYFSGTLIVNDNPKLISLLHQYNDSFSSKRVFDYFLSDL